MPAPANPAPVSGPGALARRTDGGPEQKMRELPNAQYGEAATFRDLQHGAPLAAAAPMPTSSGVGASSRGGPAVTPMSAPSGRPGEPVTTGADAGAGPGMDSLGLPSEQSRVRDQVFAMYKAFPSEALRTLLERLDES